MSMKWTKVTWRREYCPTSLLFHRHKKLMPPWQHKKPSDTTAVHQRENNPAATQTKKKNQIYCYWLLIIQIKVNPTKNRSEKTWIKLVTFLTGPKKKGSWSKKERTFWVLSFVDQKGKDDYQWRLMKKARRWTWRKRRSLELMKWNWGKR